MKPESLTSFLTRKFHFSREVAASLVVLGLITGFTQSQAGTFVEWALPVGSPGSTANLGTSSEPLHILPTFDGDGSLFFTQRDLGYLGELNPENGAITEWSLGSSSFPHDITMVGGTLVITEQGTDSIGQFDPRKSMCGTTWYRGLMNM